MFAPAQSAEIQSIDPANGSVTRSYAALSPEQLDIKIDAARQASDQYRETSLQQRALWMKKLAGILEHEMEELATMITRETGKTISSSREEVLHCAACCRHFAEHAESFLQPKDLPYAGSASTVRRTPLGVLLAILSSNAPFWQLFRSLAPCLMAGNVILLKHSSMLPQCALELETLARRAGFPGGCLQTLLLHDWQIEPVLSDVRVNAVLITGSEAPHRSLAAQAGWLNKKSILRFGAAGDFLVMPSSNLFAAIQAGVRSCLLENGQSSLSATRFLIHESIYEDFELLFTAAMEEILVGNPLKDETELGPLTSEQFVKTLERQIAAAQRAGGRVMTGGQRLMGLGNFFEPTVLVDVPAGAKLSREEILGPVALLFKVASFAEAIAFANQTPSSVNASVWTTERKEQEQASAELAFGDVFLNLAITADPQLPSSASPSPAYGREFSLDNLADFVSSRTVVSVDLQQEPELFFDLSADELPPEPFQHTPVFSPESEAIAPMGADDQISAETETPLDFKQLLERSMQAADELLEDMDRITFPQDLTYESEEHYAASTMPTEAATAPREEVQQPTGATPPAPAAIAFQQGLARLTRFCAEGQRLVRGQFSEKLKRAFPSLPPDKPASSDRPASLTVPSSETMVSEPFTASPVQAAQQIHHPAEERPDFTWRHVVPVVTPSPEAREPEPEEEQELVHASPPSVDLKQLFDRSMRRTS